jgi:hypothetical protein
MRIVLSSAVTPRPTDQSFRLADQRNGHDGISSGSMLLEHKRKRARLVETDCVTIERELRSIVRYVRQS